MKKHFNFIDGTLDVALTTTGTTITCAGLADLPTIAAPDYISLTIDATEIVHLTAHGNGEQTATIERGQEDTEAVAHAAGVTVDHTIVADDLNTFGPAEITDTDPAVVADRSQVVKILDNTTIDDLHVDAERVGLWVYSNPEITDARKVIGVKISGAPMGGYAQESIALETHWDSAAGITSPNLVAISAHVGVIGGVLTEGVAYQGFVGALSDGVVGKAIGLRFEDGNLQGTTNHALEIGDFKSQHRGPIAIGGTTITTEPNTWASVDLQHTNRALILNRLTTTQRDAMTPVEGMMIYNTTTDRVETYAGSAWRYVVDAGGTPTSGETLIYDGNSWEPNSVDGGINTWVIGPENGFVYGGGSGTTNSAAWEAMWANVNEGDRIYTPANCVVGFAETVYIDKPAVYVEFGGGARQADDPADAPGARWVATTGMKRLVVFEGPSGTTDNNRTYQNVIGACFDGAGLCTKEVVLVNGREHQIDRFSVLGLSSGSVQGRPGGTNQGLGLMAGVRIGPDDTAVTMTSFTSNTFTVSGGHGFADLELIACTAVGGSFTGVTLDSQYYVIYVSSTTFKIATTRDNARAGTAITLGGTLGTTSFSCANNAQDCDLTHGRIMGDGDNGIDYTVGVHVYKAADCLIDNVKPVKCDIDFYLRGATTRLANCHPFHGSTDRLPMSQTTAGQFGFANIVIAGQGHRIADCYLDNGGTAGIYTTTTSSTELATNGAWIILNCDESQCTDISIDDVIFNNGPGGSDTCPAIRIINSSNLCTGLTINGTTFHGTSSALNYHNGAAAFKGTSGTHTVSAATDTFTTSAAHQLLNYAPIRFTNIGGATGISTGTTYYVIVVSTTTYKIATSRANAIAGTAINVTGDGTGLVGVGWRTSLFKHLVVASNWNNIYGFIFDGNTSRWMWDAASEITNGTGDVRPCRPFLDLNAPTQTVAPDALGQNVYNVGDDITTGGDANTTVYYDTNLVVLASYTANNGTSKNHKCWGTPKFRSAAPANAAAGGAGAVWVSTFDDTTFKLNSTTPASGNYHVRFSMANVTDGS